MLANFILFQIGWFACVLGGAHGLPWLGVGVALAIVVWHLAHASQPGRELALMLIVTAIGALFESALVALGWVRYPSGTLVHDAAPVWLVAIWTLFATTLNVSLRRLRRFRLAACVFGALVGPLAYWSGAGLGAIEFASPVVATTALAVGWAALTPALASIAGRFDGFAPVRAPAQVLEPRRA